jgi:hypothetical protein
MKWGVRANWKEAFQLSNAENMIEAMLKVSKLNASEQDTFERNIY